MNRTSTIAQLTNYHSGIETEDTMSDNELAVRLGRRVSELLWDDGVKDVGGKYSQQELLAWLRGEAVAPNGKRYDIRSANYSTLNRIINGNMQRPPLEILTAIADIFDRSLHWLITGDERTDGGYNDPYDVFIHTESSAIGKLADEMDESNRTLVLEICRSIRRLEHSVKRVRDEVAMKESELSEKDVELREIQKELASVWTNTIEDIPENQRRAISRLVARAHESSKR